MSNRVQGLRLKSALHAHANKLATNLGVRVAAGGITVQFSGGGAFAVWSDHNDPRKVVHGVVRYPTVPDAAMLTRGEADLFTGYTLHEVGHIAFTDNSLKAHKAYLGVEQALVFKIWNGIEDGRMESAVVRDGRSRGARSALKRLLNKMTLDVPPDWSPTALKHAPFALALLSRASRGVGNGFANTLLRRIPEPKRSLYAEAYARMAALPVEKSAGTQGSWNVAVWFYEEWKKRFGVNIQGRIIRPDDRPNPITEPPKPDGGHVDTPLEEGEDDDTVFDDQLDKNIDPNDLPESEDDEPAVPPIPKNGDDEGEEGEQPGTQPGEQSEEDEEGEEGDSPIVEPGMPTDSDEESEEPEDKTLVPGDAGGEPDDEEGDTSEHHAASGDAEIPFDAKDSDDTVNSDAEVKSPEPDLTDVGKRIKDRTKDKKELRSMAPANFSDMSKWKNAAKQMFEHEAADKTLHSKMLAGGAAKVKALIARLLTAPERIGWDGGAFAGRFDRRRYVPAMNGSEAVFKRRWETEGLNTALSLVIDLSGSMGGGEGSSLGLAVDAAYAIADAAEKARCPVEILGFSDVFGGSQPAARLPDMGGTQEWTGAGSGGYALVVAKKFNAKLATCAANIGKLKWIKTGGTPDYPCVHTAAMRLSARPEQRKILMVLTDGCGYGDMADLSLAAEELMGVTIIGIGINMAEPTGAGDERYDSLARSYPVLRAYVPSISELAGKSMQTLEKHLRETTKHRRVM
jgi:hypothetical protein